jgi:ABC-2 type transport system permease protein
MKSLITLFKIELTLSMREFSGMLFGILLPAGLMLLLGILYKDTTVNDGSGITLLQLAFPSVISISICATGLMGIPLTLSSYRDKKILKRFQITPTSPFTLLMAQFLNQLVFVGISVASVWFIARFIFDYRMIGQLGPFLLTFIIVLLSIYSIGMLIASVSKNVNTTNLLCSALYFPMFFLSGATVPYEIMPKGLQLFANIMPLTHGIKALKAISTGDPLSSQSTTLMSLLFIAIICIIISTKTFRYDYQPTR